MQVSVRGRRLIRKVMLIAAAGVLPAFFMRCDKAALNVQRGFFEGVGIWVSQTLVEQGLNLDSGT